jgi:hypothetical protein
MSPIAPSCTLRHALIADTTISGSAGLQALRGHRVAAVALRAHWQRRVASRVNLNQRLERS